MSLDPRIAAGTTRMLAVRSAVLASGVEPLGWKLGFGAPTAMTTFGIDRPLIGFLTRDRLLASGSSASVSGWTKPLLEAERIPGMSGIYSSPVAAGGHVYFTGRDGAVVVAKESDKMEIVHTAKLEEAFEASPAIAGGDLILRGHGTLYCFAEKK